MHIHPTFCLVKHIIYHQKLKIILKTNMENRSQKKVTLQNPLDPIMQIKVKLHNDENSDSTSQSGSHGSYVTPEKWINVEKSNKTKDFWRTECLGLTTRAQIIPIT